MVYVISKQQIVKMSLAIRNVLMRINEIDPELVGNLMKQPNSSVLSPFYDVRVHYILCMEEQCIYFAFSLNV